MNIWRFWANGTGQSLCIEQKLQNQLEILSSSIQSLNLIMYQDLVMGL